MVPYELYPLGEQAVVIRWDGDIEDAMQRTVTEAMRCLEQEDQPYVTELVRSYRTVTVYYDPFRVYLAQRSGKQPPGEMRESPYELMARWIRSRLEAAATDGLPAKASAEEDASAVVIPVCFGGEYGADLEHIAGRAGIGPQEAIDLYCSAVYSVHMIGFLPGFPYMSGLPGKLAAPRRSEPRLEVPGGSVGIAGMQTGIYPIVSPGGWQLIGRTPIRLFDPGRERPSLLQAGDRVRFKPIGEEDFVRLSAG